MRDVPSLRSTSMLAAGLVAAASLGGAPEARACSIAPGITGTEPETGQSLPEGSRVLLFGAIDIEALSVDIDGVPTTLGRDAGYPSVGFSSAYRLGTTAPEGSTVTIRDCYPGDEAGCDGAPSYSWQVGPPDEDASPPADRIEFGIYDHRDVDTSGDTCTGDGILDATIYVHTRVPADVGPGAPRHALIEVFDAETVTLQGTQVRSVPPEGGELSAALSLPEGVLTSPLAESTCVQVTVFDLSGNVSDSISSCEPTHVGADADQSPDPSEYDAPEEPDWDSLSDPEALGRGCACGLGSPSERGMPWLLVLLLAPLSRRRPRR